MKIKVVLLLLSVWMSSLFATQVRPLNLDELIQHSGIVFLGKVTAKRLHYGDITTFEVIEPLKGQNLGKTYEVKQIRIGSRPMVSFSLGEEVVVFLYKPSAKGFSSPVGFEQGKFAVTVKDKINESVLRPTSFQKNNMWKRMSPNSLKTLKAAGPATPEVVSLGDLKNLIQAQAK